MATGPRRVLITNIRLALASGTEIYVDDLARGLQRRGQEPIVFSPQLGPIADRVRERGIAVADDLATVPRPDVIHGHHTLETALASLRFPDVPAVFVSHSSTSRFDRAPGLSTVRAHVAVDLAVRDRLVVDCGIDAGAIDVIGNGIDLRRFGSRARPLPSRPRRALVFSNSAHGSEWAGAVRAACERAGIALDRAGLGDGPLDRPERVLPEYDLVFAKARCAMEALAVGCAVIVCDHAGVGGMVTAARVEELRPYNFGLRTMQDDHTPDVLDAAIAAYDSEDAAKASQQFRGTGGLDAMVDALVAVHDRVLAMGPVPGLSDADRARLSSLFRRASADDWAADDLRTQLTGLTHAHDHLAEQVATLEAHVRQVAGTEALVAELTARVAAEGADASRLGVELDEARAELAAVVATRTWRARNRLLPLYSRVRRQPQK